MILMYQKHQNYKSANKTDFKQKKNEPNPKEHNIITHKYIFNVLQIIEVYD